MADDEYIISTRYSESYDFIYVKKNELSFENYVLTGKIYQLPTNISKTFLYSICFLSAVAKAFKVERDLDFKVKLKANNNIVLTKSNFNRIVEYYSHCACFHITVHMDVKTTPDVVITPDVSPEK